MGALDAAVVVSIARCHPSSMSVVVVSIVRNAGTTGQSGWGTTWRDRSRPSMGVDRRVREHR